MPDHFCSKGAAVLKHCGWTVRFTEQSVLTSPGDHCIHRKGMEKKCLCWSCITTPELKDSFLERRKRLVWPEKKITHKAHEIPETNKIYQVALQEDGSNREQARGKRLLCMLSCLQSLQIDLGRRVLCSSLRLGGLFGHVIALWIILAPINNSNKLVGLSG